MPYPSDSIHLDWDTLPPPGKDHTGQDVYQVFHQYPSLKILYPFEWESKWNGGGAASSWAGDNMHIAYVLVTLYVLLVFGVQRHMKDKDRVEAKSAWKWWNLGLSIFSFCGAARTVPHLISSLLHPDRGFKYTVCYPASEHYGYGACGLWTMLFIFSKIPELFDTAFIVVLKAKLNFLHWYHHITVLLYCWHSYGTRNAAGLWFISMNYSVHAIMYFYYFISQYYPKGETPCAFFVTSVQISQMFVGVVVCFFTWYFKSRDETCSVTWENWRAGLLMYLSYFGLFVSFAINRYCACSRRKGEEKAMNKDEKKKRD